MKNYINYLKRQNKYVQDIYAIAFATIGTLIVTIFWLQYHYHLFTPEYKRLEVLPPAHISYNIDSIATSTVIDYKKYDPADYLYKIFKEIKEMINLR